MYKLIFSAFILFMSPMLIAHLGTHGSDISIKILSAKFTNKSATISLILSNKGMESVLIESIHSNVGEVDFALNYPLEIASTNQFKFTKTLNLIVKNTQNIPQIFTLIFDFGEAGSGPVTIIPTSFQE